VTAKILRIAEHEYHSDPCKTPSLSASIAKILVERSPLHAWTAHPKLGGVRHVANDAMDHGSLVHKLLLGAGADVAVIDADDWRTKAAKEARDAARADGKIPVLKEQHERALRSVEPIRKQIAAHGFELTGESEVCIVWQEETIHGAIECRCLVDHLMLDRALMFDVKTARSAHPRSCVRHVIDYGYDIQQAAYTRALTKLRPDLAGREDFVFLFVETDEPFAATPARIDAVMRERGKRRWEEACSVWARCLKTGSWPGYVDGAVYLETPAWVMGSMEESGA
jgi:hypothetical protein